MGKSVWLQFCGQPIEPTRKKGLLSLGIQAIKAHVLRAVIVGAVVKSVDHIEGRRIGVNAPRAGVRFQLVVVGRWQPILKLQLAVVEDVLTDVAQVHVQTSTRFVF